MGRVLRFVKITLRMPVLCRNGTVVEVLYAPCILNQGGSVGCGTLRATERMQASSDICIIKNN
ncbi:hypothetical protein I7I50_00292 [Histoplasma capsulatum G186AR]|uniref:Uncharacterized protein n=1 Tax=Ajellomyces capsulatus TaxID=5037 RepID=A0A8H7YDP9_AJECA|nr:hypothetical protein I7I52_07560 [Histoplasma capsulatum]QSS72442.1 hypothetical protein I7I50_00292 [Histoplasma capsulatum G186AR]